MQCQPVIQASVSCNGFLDLIMFALLCTFARFVHFPRHHQGAHSANKDFLRFRFGVLEILKSLEIIVADSSLDFF